MHIIVNRSKNIFFCDMFWNQIVNIASDCVFQFIDVACCLFQESCQNRIVYQLCHADFLRINIYNTCQVYHHIGKNFNASFLVCSLDPYIWNSSILNLFRQFSGDLGSSFSNHFTCQYACNRLCQNLTCDTVLKRKLFIEFVSSYFCKVITSRIKEHAGNQALCTVYCQRLSRTNLLI